ncbi:sugar phosphate isomerase/epimerase family protein [Methanolobus psychrotolerans]|uniref:sugar phosphate isomerase/epimerase family protein n=1 Tax=Methanolobus psychrotolerans TaxID=1874706 RepID=UPI000B919C98|nr:sugar phosphate isomerase/epimerase [Methanolobus psychrotolerans]
MNVRNLSFSSRASVEDPFNWAYSLEDIGYTGWEIVQEGSQCLNDENIHQVRDILETTNLTLTMHLPFSDMNIAGLNTGIHNEVMRQMQYYLEMASDLAELAVLHPGYLSAYGGQVPDKAWQVNIESIQQLCDFAEDRGILIAVENMPELPKIFGKIPDEMLDMLKEVDRKNVGMTLDVGHANTMGLVDEFVEKCLSRIKHMHIHDNHGVYDEHLPLGHGTVDWKKLMGSLSGYNGRLVTEMGSLDEGRQCLEYLKKL